MAWCEADTPNLMGDMTMEKHIAIAENRTLRNGRPADEDTEDENEKKTKEDSGRPDVITLWHHAAEGN